jgi:putative DNA primase/helicase
VIEWDQLREGNSRVPCPECGKGPRDRTCGVTVGGNRGIAHCYRCQYVGFRDGVPAEGGRILSPTSTTHARLSDYGLDLWNECVPLSGAALSYLQARQCLIPPADGAVSYHARLKHFSGYVGPALVALITDAITGEPISLHRTWIEANGEKAKVEPPRLLLKDHRKQGGVVRLWPDEAVTTGLAITEGIETALSLAHAFTPVWACIDAGNLAAFPVLPGIEALTIGADNDEAGRRAADACAKRWLAAGREVRIILPFVEKTDFNDLARAA